MSASLWLLFCSVFYHPVEGREGRERLLSLHQGSRTASEFAKEFQTITASTGWNESSLVTCSAADCGRRYRWS